MMNPFFLVIPHFRAGILKHLFKVVVKHLHHYPKCTRRYPFHFILFIYLFSFFNLYFRLQTDISMYPRCLPNYEIRLMLQFIRLPQRVGAPDARRAVVTRGY